MQCCIRWPRCEAHAFEHEADTAQVAVNICTVCFVPLPAVPALCGLVNVQLMVGMWRCPALALQAERPSQPAAEHMSEDAAPSMQCAAHNGWQPMSHSQSIVPVCLASSSHVCVSYSDAWSCVPCMIFSTAYLIVLHWICVPVPQLPSAESTVC
jgi:hypothetical protein